MWITDSIQASMNEMIMIDGSLQSVIIFTIITSSSIISVVGVLRHIYRYLYKSEVNNVSKSTQTSATYEKPSYDTLGTKFRLVRSGVLMKKAKSFNRCKDMLYDCQQRKYKQVLHRKQQNAKKLKCLKCNIAQWERYCVHGLCDGCCEKGGWCHKTKHSYQPHFYDPWVGWTDQQSVQLSYQTLKEVPVRLGFYCMQATSLDISHNRLSCLSEHIALMRWLKQINLSYNQLSNIPTFFRCFHQLSVLDLRHNKLSIFPEAVLDLPFLCKLYLDHNKDLSFLPNDIHRMKSLSELGLGHTLVAAIPNNLFKIIELKLLRLCCNRQMCTLSPDIKHTLSLEVLDLSRCSLRFLPSAIGQCCMLQDLDVSHNRLTLIPCEISQCYRLEKLTVSHNRLLTLPAALLYKQGLTHLETNGNSFMSQTEPSRWLVVDSGSISEQANLVPSLQNLVRSSIQRHKLSIDCLPFPLQEAVSSFSSCFECGLAGAVSCVRAVCFLRFNDISPSLPFLYTFCSKHFEAVSPNKLVMQLEKMAENSEWMKQF